MKKLVFLSCIGLLFFILASSFNPFDKRMFNFHDETQLGRITNFALNLRNGQIPPRLAPEFSFQLGFPVFNFYAPFSYWVTTSLHLLGFSPPGALKFSFLLTMALSFFAMYLFLRNIFNFYSSILGASLYVTSTYFASLIMIRGNLAESWFLALFPLSLFFLLRNSHSRTRLDFLLTTLVLSFLFTVHNIFSLVSLVLVVFFAFLLPRKKSNLIAVFFALFLGAYFLFPALLETNLVQVKNIITGYNYQDHFLCLWQIWSSSGWNFGASLPGCDSDLMSFKLGKLHVILGLLGLFYLLIRLLKRQKSDLQTKISIYVGIIFVGSLFMTLSYSQVIWDSLSHVLALFQFPWRFMLLGIFGSAYFGAYFFHRVKVPFKNILICFVIVVTFVTARKYLIKPLYDYKEYEAKYNSLKYRKEQLAYMMPEYITEKASSAYWSSFNPAIASQKKIGFDYSLPIESTGKFRVEKNDYFEKIVVVEEPQKIHVNIHYFPYWQVSVDGRSVQLKRFDPLGRPVLTLSKPGRVTIAYEQTPIEKIGNSLTLLAFFFLIYVVWKKPAIVYT